MKKQVHKLLDEKGRILIPNEFRQMTEMECGDIVKLSVSGVKKWEVRIRRPWKPM